MDILRFGEFKTGSIIAIETVRGCDWAFVPKPLPPEWTLPVRLWPMVVKARDRIARLNGVGLALPDPFLLLRPLQRREALRSSSLEGTYISAKELLLFEVDKQRRSGKDARAAEWREVYNYYLALQKGRTRIKDDKLNLDLVKTLHKMLMSGTRGQEKSPGEFRDCQVHVGIDHRYNPPPPEYLSECLANLDSAISQPDEKNDALVRAYLTHYQFEAIHPFRDGNGRIGRLVLSLIIFDWLELSEPWLYMSEFFERNREAYVEKMFRISANGEWDEWIEFCLEGTIQEAEAAIKRCAQLGKLKEKYLQMVGRANTRMPMIIEMLFSTPVLNMSEIRKRFKVTYPTAKSDINKLMDAGIVTAIDNTYPQGYGAQEIMQIAFN